MSEIKTGVFPVHGIEIKISTSGVTSELTGLSIIADLETFKITIDGVVVDWSPLEQKGWKRRLMTGKSITISVNGKRNFGDPGNDYLASLAHKTGQEATTTVQVGFPDGAKLTMNAVVDIKDYNGGDSVDVMPLSADFLSDGKPTYTPAVGG